MSSLWKDVSPTHALPETHDEAPCGVNPIASLQTYFLIGQFIELSVFYVFNCVELSVFFVFNCNVYHHMITWRNVYLEAV